jgi:hypothetical protein
VPQQARTRFPRLGTNAPSGVPHSAVPTVLRVGPYRIYFYSHEPNESAHVHVDRDDQSAKLWLNPVALARNLGFSAQELRSIERVLSESEDTLLEA